MGGLSVTDHRDMHVAGSQPSNDGDEYPVPRRDPHESDSLLAEASISLDNLVEVIDNLQVRTVPARTNPESTVVLLSETLGGEGIPGVTCYEGLIRQAAEEPGHSIVENLCVVPGGHSGTCDVLDVHDESCTKWAVLWGFHK